MHPYIGFLGKSVESVNELLTYGAVCKLEDQSILVPPMHIPYIPIHPKDVQLYPFPIHALHIEFIELANAGTNISLQLIYPL